jgi:hypothetical protein
MKKMKEEEMRKLYHPPLKPKLKKTLTPQKVKSRERPPPVPPKKESKEISKKGSSSDLVEQQHPQQQAKSAPIQPQPHPN